VAFRVAQGFANSRMAFAIALPTWL